MDIVESGKGKFTVIGNFLFGSRKKFGGFRHAVNGIDNSIGSFFDFIFNGFDTVFQSGIFRIKFFQLALKFFKMFRVTAVKSVFNCCILFAYTDYRLMPY